MHVRPVLLGLFLSALALALWVHQPWANSPRRFFVHNSAAVALGKGGHADLMDGVSATMGVDALQQPWDLAFLSATEILVTEKAGTLLRIDLRTGERRSVSGVPEVSMHGQGGLHAVVLHPQFVSNGQIYLSYAAVGDSGGFTTHFLRARLDGDVLREQKLLFRAQAATGAGQHFGGALLFDREGYLFASVGDRGDGDKAQDLGFHNGKILRLRDDGSVPADNPYLHTPGALPEIWSYGHRNPQGLALDAATGRLWEAEHGPQGGDEINLIQRGRNYGWPVITYGREYGTGFKIGEGTARADVAAPVHHYVPSIATAGMAFYDGAMFPEWKNCVFVAALRGHLNRVQLDDQGRFVKEERLLGDQDLRIRGVRVSPSGELWVITDNGVILRITRKKT